ncbi:hypothetical protein I3843_13G116100 [Carya illinoinensis]|uniref:GIR1-like zinc ribbon domain-containing protein n=1 Tax=Carya illinoinensis TaxID=32201 RepID=A0A8T1NQU9_CARIL|nr:hypothetical protein CIPAW_13G132200 [Carya illinoinensis]KAG6632052.1 hypothetical protein CIPAW_13G132200 [Carya illinoinensis]KAG6682272.1 hypothetical protein I3842_13G131100 [Carya illinoinensis]KAG7950498.1 hypothetical protein I3843_13G116100 [Carya illinoinensis]
MSKRANGRTLELRLNLSPPRREHSPAESIDVSTSSSSEISVEGSCVSSEPEDKPMTLQYSPSNSEARSMMLVGCPRCLMYVMLSELADPKCPKCKSTVLLDFLKEENARNTRN